MEADINTLMFEYCQSRDIELRNELLTHYLYIAEIAAKKFVGRGVEYDDLFQVASLALIRALERFDFDRNVKFGSFATPSVIGEIKNYFRDKRRSIRLPRRTNEMLKKLYDAQEELSLINNRPPKPEELAQKLALPVDVIYELLEAKASMQVLSLDETVSHQDGDRSLADMIGEESSEYVSIENKDFLLRNLDTLSEIERDVILKRYVECKSQRQIAEDLDVSQMYISRMERKVLDRLRSRWNG